MRISDARVGMRLRTGVPAGRAAVSKKKSVQGEQEPEDRCDQGGHGRCKSVVGLNVSFSGRIKC